MVGKDVIYALDVSVGIQGAILLHILLKLIDNIDWFKVQLKKGIT